MYMYIQCVYANLTPFLLLQSVVYKDGVAFTISEVSITSNESTSTEIGMTKLHQACKDGNLDMVRDELDTGAPIGEQEIFNGVPMLPLFISFLHDHRHVREIRLSETSVNFLCIHLTACC